MRAPGPAIRRANRSCISLSELTSQAASPIASHEEDRQRDIGSTSSDFAFPGARSHVLRWNRFVNQLMASGSVSFTHARFDCDRIAPSLHRHAATIHRRLVGYRRLSLSKTRTPRGPRYCRALRGIRRKRRFIRARSASEPIRSKSTEQVAEDPAPRLSGRGRGVPRRRLATNLPRALRLANRGPRRHRNARCPSQTDPARAPGRRCRCRRRPRHLVRNATPSLAPAMRQEQPVPARRHRASSGVRDCDRFRDGASDAPGLFRSLKGSSVLGGAVRGALPRGSGFVLGMPPAGSSVVNGSRSRGRFGISGVRRGRRCTPVIRPELGRLLLGNVPRRQIPERLLPIRSLGARASPTGRERPPALGMIAEILLLVDLVGRIFLIARDPLPPDRRQREEPGLLSFDAPDRLTAPVSTTIVSAWATLLEFVRILASSARGDCLASEISWAEAVPLSPTNLSRSIGFPRSLTTANLEKGGIIRALRK